MLTWLGDRWVFSVHSMPTRSSWRPIGAEFAKSYNEEHKAFNMCLVLAFWWVQVFIQVERCG